MQSKGQCYGSKGLIGSFVLPNVELQRLRFGHFPYQPPAKAAPRSIVKLYTVHTAAQSMHGNIEHLRGFPRPQRIEIAHFVAARHGEAQQRGSHLLPSRDAQMQRGLRAAVLRRNGHGVIASGPRKFETLACHLHIRPACVGGHVQKPHALVHRHTHVGHTAVSPEAHSVAALRTAPVKELIGYARRGILNATAAFGKHRQPHLGGLA